MDPVVTLGVLCDQVVPVDETLDEEDQAIRDRLRSLVLAFLTGEAYRGITERHVNTPGSPAEDVLVSGLLKVGRDHIDTVSAVLNLFTGYPSVTACGYRYYRQEPSTILSLVLRIVQARA